MIRSVAGDLALVRPRLRRAQDIVQCNLVAEMPIGLLGRAMLQMFLVASCIGRVIGQPIVNTIARGLYPRNQAILTHVTNLKFTREL